MWEHRPLGNTAHLKIWKSNDFVGKVDCLLVAQYYQKYV